MYLIKFSADWCAPCKTFHPIFVEVSKLKEFENIKFIEVDIESDVKIDGFDLDGMELTQKYDIKSVPTVILFSDNLQLNAKKTGLIPTQIFIEWIRTTKELLLPFEKTTPPTLPENE